MKNIIILLSSLVLGTIGHLATDIYLPSLPYIAEYFNTSHAWVKFTLSVYMFSFCLTPLLIGPLSDHIGRKKPILMGIFISFFATLLCALSPNIYTLVFARLLQGIGLGIIVSVSRALLPDHFSGKQLAKYFSYMVTMMPLVLAMGPPLGGVIQENSSWRMVFVFLLIYLIFLFSIVKMVFQNNPSDPSPQVRNRDLKFYITTYQSLFKNDSFLRYALCSVIVFIGIMGYLTTSPFLFKELLGLSPTQYGFTALIICGVTFISGFLNSYLINYCAPKILLYLASFLILCSGFLLIVFSKTHSLNLYFLLFCFAVFFLAVPLSFANIGVIALSKTQGSFGAATALLSTLQYFGGGLSSVGFSFVSETSTFPIGITFIFLGILYFVLLYREKLLKPALVQEETSGTPSMEIPIQK